jgi:hypothetical protein
MRERLRDYSTDNHIFVYLENGILRKSSVGLQLGNVVDHNDCILRKFSSIAS